MQSSSVEGPCTKSLGCTTTEQCKAEAVQEMKSNGKRYCAAIHHSSRTTTHPNVYCVKWTTALKPKAAYLVVALTFCDSLPTTSTFLGVNCCFGSSPNALFLGATFPLTLLVARTALLHSACAVSCTQASLSCCQIFWPLVRQKRRSHPLSETAKTKLQWSMIFGLADVTHTHNPWK